MSAEIEAMVKATIQAQIVQAMKSTPDAISELVKAALSKGVNSRTGGENVNYSETRVPYLDYLVGEMIREAARSAVREVVQERSDEIKRSIKAAITAERTVDAMAEKIIGIMGEDWKVDISFRDERRR